MKAPVNNSSQGTAEQYLVTPGSLGSICIGVFDIGNWKTVFAGEEKIKHKLLIRFEVDEKIEGGEYDGKNKCLNKWYNFSMHPKSTLRKDIQSWRGRELTDEEAEDFDLCDLVGQQCLLSVVNKDGNGRTFQNITSISTVPKGMSKVKADVLYKDGDIPEFIEKIKEKSYKPENDTDPF